MKSPDEQVLEECLAGFILGELTEEEFQQLGDLTVGQRAGTVKELERVAALVSLAGVDQGEEMPASLRQNIIAQGRSWVAQSSERPQPSSALQLSAAPAASSQAVRLREAVAWLACLAATIVALVLWRSPIDARRDQPVAMTRASLMASAADLIQTEWTDGKTPLPAKVIGDVVWSNSAQQGFMKFVGLPINNPSVEQYQLWIIDPSRDDEPIDGGVFNITKPGETIVPIQAKLPVGQPKAFAVTIEKPGGVVVSTQERLPLLAVVQ